MGGVWPGVRYLGGWVTSYVEFSDVTKVYRDFRGRPVATGIEGLSFSIREGETLALLGPNGSGKTTVIKLLAGLLIPTSGRITVGGVDVIQNPRKALENVGVMLGDARSIYWRLTAQDNLEYFGALRGVCGKKLRERIGALARLLDFESVLTRRVGELSRGMRQRLLLAIALLPNPRLLILDEPTFGLDVLSRHEIRRLLREIVSTKHCAIVIATHQMEEAEELAGRVCILRRGKAVALDTVEGLTRKINGARDGQVASSLLLEEVFLEVTREESKGRAEVFHDRAGYPLG
ncbi:MAG TPA: ABC transporter ATP-binding protein [Bacillota bacterium]|nr:ABC transporter ATP-binding protein [Bacillota bacterium]